MSNGVRVVVAGASGRLGSRVVEAVERAPDLTLAGTLVRGDDAGSVLDRRRVDVLVDFSLAPASRELVPLAARRGIAPVVGTSGLDDADLVDFTRACRDGDVGGLVVPNFSLGAVLQMRFAAEAARWLACVGIDEVHHPAKRDSPSGTARATAARVAAASGREPPITSERRTGVLARQQVAFGHGTDRLVLLHEVSDRSAYLPGILLAVRRVRSLTTLTVGLEAVLDEPAGKPSNATG